MSTKGKHFKKANPQRTKLLAGIAEGKTLKQASEEAGYSCVESAHNAIRHMRAEFVAAMRQAGHGPQEFIRKDLLPLLKRKKTLFFSNGGIVTDKREVPDTDAHIRAAEIYCKIMGAYAPTSNGQDGRTQVDVGIKHTFDFSGFSTEELIRIVTLARR